MSMNWGWSQHDYDLYGYPGEGSLEDALAELKREEEARAEAEAWYATHTMRFSFDGHTCEVAVGENAPACFPLYACRGFEGNTPGEWRIDFEMRALPESLLPAPITPELVARFTPVAEGIWFRWDEALQALVPRLRWEAAYEKALAKARRRMDIIVGGERYQFPIRSIKSAHAWEKWQYEGVADVNGKFFPVRFFAEEKGGHWELAEK